MSEIAPANCFDSCTGPVGGLSRSYAAFGYGKLGSSSLTTGPWLDTRLLKSVSSHVKGTFGGASLQFFGSNDEDPNVSGDTGIALGAAITVAGLASLQMPCRWVRAVLSGATGTTAISANVHGCL